MIFMKFRQMTFPLIRLSNLAKREHILGYNMISIRVQENQDVLFLSLEQHLNKI